jgi:type IV secretory pathway TrbF-like protein
MSERETYSEAADRGAKNVGTMLTMKDMQILKWQRISYILVFLVFVCILSVVYIGTKATYVPYVIHVDEKTGYVMSLGALEQRNVEPTDAEISYFLSRFVEGIRSVPEDKNVLQRSVNRAVKFMTPEAANKYKNLYLPEFTARIGHINTRVEILSVQPIAGQSNTYTVRWKESSADGGGVPVDTYYTGNFAVKTETITKKEDLVLNPIGLFITDFSYAPEMAGR